MRKFAYKLATGAATAALLAGALAPSVFAADLEITDNGADSDNAINITDVSVCNVEQRNTTLVGAIVGASASTGGNQANGNTGGNVSVASGNATANASLTVTGGNNTAVNPCCCDQCEDTDSTAVISDNGRRSRNRINRTGVKVSNVEQRTFTGVEGFVGARARTGWNRANGNTGGGTTTVMSGRARSNASFFVTGGSNSLTNP